MNKKFRIVSDVYVEDGVIDFCGIFDNKTDDGIVVIGLIDDNKIIKLTIEDDVPYTEEDEKEIYNFFTKNREKVIEYVKKHV